MKAPKGSESEIEDIMNNLTTLLSPMFSKNCLGLLQQYGGILVECYRL
jgi:hypothetical protein